MTVNKFADPVNKKRALHLIDYCAIEAANKGDRIAFGGSQCGLVVERDEFAALLDEAGNQATAKWESSAGLLGIRSRLSGKVVGPLTIELGHKTPISKGFYAIR